MKFNLKLTEKNNPLKVKIEEGVEAENEQALLFMYDTMGYNVQVMSREGQSVANPVFEQLINTPAQSSGQRKPEAKPIITTINGMKIKIVNGIFYKLDWIDLTDGAYRVHPDDARLHNLNGKMKIRYQKLDWIEIKNEEPEAEEEIEEEKKE